MRTVVLDGTGLARLDAGAWDRLSSCALAENPFYGRRHVLAGLESIEQPRQLRAVAVWRDDTRLAGLFPYRLRRVLAFTAPVAEGAANLYQFSGMPLVDAEVAAPAVGAWLDAMRDDGRQFWSLGNVDLDSPLLPPLTSIVAGRGLSLHAIGTYLRPRLTRLEGGFEAHVATAIPKRRLREIERHLRRLREAGSLRFERTADPACVAGRLDQFLALEHAGWKGRLGTSFLSRPADAAFARAAYADAVVDSLLLDDAPIAISINLAQGRTAFTPKGAYDERWRSFAPGLVLEYLAIQEFYADGRFDEVDAATTVEGHVVSRLWNESKRMARLVIGPADWRTGALAAAWERKLALEAGAKRIADGRSPLRAAIRAVEPLLARARTGMERLASVMRSGFSGFFTAAVLALPGLYFYLKRHEPLAAGLAGI